MNVKKKLLRINNFFSIYGINLFQMMQSFRGTPSYLRDFITIRKMLGKSDAWKFGKIYPCLSDRYQTSGEANGHYFHQDLLVARWIHERNPNRHIDVASRIDGFVAHVASFRQIDVFDIRPLSTNISNIKFTQMDLMKVLPKEQMGLSDSVSCLHALEHFGLGRYGDTLDPIGYRLGFENLTKLLKIDGILYFSVPIGPQRIEFNAHRIFCLKHLFELFDEYKLSLIRFSYVNDQGNLIENVALSKELINNNCGVTNGCGIFELKKNIGASL